MNTIFASAPSLPSPQNMKHNYMEAAITRKAPNHGDPLLAKPCHHVEWEQGESLDFSVKCSWCTTKTLHAKRVNGCILKLPLFHFASGSKTISTIPFVRGTCLWENEDVGNRRGGSQGIFEPEAKWRLYRLKRILIYSVFITNILNHVSVANLISQSRCLW